MYRDFFVDECGLAIVRVLRAVVLSFLLCAVAGCGSSSSSSSSDNGGDDGIYTDSCAASNPPSWCAKDYEAGTDTNSPPRDATFSAHPSPSVTLPANPADYDDKVEEYKDVPFFAALHSEPIKAANAYARGATGKEVTITIVDTGIDVDHDAFGRAGKVTVRKLIGTYTPTGAQLRHGTAVAAIAAGAGVIYESDYGIAFDAKIDFLATELGESLLPFDALGSEPAREPTPVPDDAEDTRDIDYALFFDNIIRHANGDIINFSFGAPGAISTYTRADIRRGWARTAAALAQTGVDDANKKIITWMAGNQGDDSPEFLAGLGVDFPELQSHIIAVVALGLGGKISSASSRCGIAKNFCITAPGFVDTADSTADSSADDYDPSTFFFGTDFAAPIVAGSLAILKQFFRDQLGNTELVDRLFATANRDGEYADSDIYGQGLVDLDNATKPQGVMSTAMPGDKNSMPLSQTGITLNGNAFGASFAELSEIEIAGFDELGAPFFFPATVLIAHAAIDNTPPPTKLTATMPQGELALRVGADNVTQSGYIQQGGWVLGYGENPAQFFGAPTTRDIVNNAFNFTDSDNRFNHIHSVGFGNNNAFVAPYLAFTQNGASAGWRHDNGRFGFALMHGNAHFGQWQDNGGERGLGLLIDWTTRTRHGAFAIQAGAVRETDSLLGARVNNNNAQNDLSASTIFAGINLARRFGNWQTLATAYFGNTNPTAHNAHWKIEDTIKSGAFALGATRQSLRHQHDQLTIRLTQPLRTERAQATLTMPAGRTKYGEVTHQQHDVDLSPNGRNLQLEAAYQTPVGNKNNGANQSAFKTALGVERHPMHDAARDSRWYVRLGVETRF